MNNSGTRSVFTRFIFRNITAILLFLLGGCAVVEPVYINSDRYDNFQDYFFTNINTKNKNYRLVLTFDENMPEQEVKEALSIISKNAWSKSDAYIIITYPVSLNNSQDGLKLIKGYFDTIDDIIIYIKSIYIKKNEHFKNKLYIIGISSPSILKYQVFLYFTPKTGK